MIQNNKKWLTIVQNGPNMSKKVKMVQSGLIWTNMVQNDSKGSEIVQHGQK